MGDYPCPAFISLFPRLLALIPPKSLGRKISEMGIHSASSFPKLRLRTRDKEETLVMTTAGDACCLCDGPALFSEAGTCSGRVLYLI